MGIQIQSMLFSMHVDVNMYTNADMCMYKYTHIRRNLYVYICTYVYAYIYIHAERERERGSTFHTISKEKHRFREAYHNSLDSCSSRRGAGLTTEVPVVCIHYPGHPLAQRGSSFRFARPQTTAFRNPKTSFWKYFGF